MMACLCSFEIACKNNMQRTENMKRREFGCLIKQATGAALAAPAVISTAAAQTDTQSTRLDRGTYIIKNGAIAPTRLLRATRRLMGGRP